MWDSILDNGTAERRFIYAICFFAMVRVFLLNAAYPVFTPVDELQHFDTIVKHARGEIYKRGNIDFHLNLWSAKMQVLYGSPEFMRQVPKDSVPPFLKMNDFVVNAIAEKIVDSIPNHEIHSPPIYYFIAGKWFNIGNYLISNEGFLLYWLRFMNVIFYGFLLWLAYIFCKKFFPENDAIRVGVPLILAVFPNDVFFSMNSDVLSPLFCLLTLYMLFQIYTLPQSVLSYTLTGFAIAGTVLVKLTNFPMFVLSMGLVMILLYRRIKNKQLTGCVWHFAALIVAALAPILLWMGSNLYLFGDLMGTAGKLKVFGITRKPFLEWFNHPIFHIHGLKIVADNLNLLIDTFWRGEVVWGMHTPSPYVADLFYTFSSIIFAGAGIVKLTSNSRKLFSSKSLFRSSFASLLIIYIGFLILLSIQFDFGNCFAPSRENPFFNKGRLILGSLVPFLIFYVDGLLYILYKIKLKLNPMVIIGTICLVLFTFSCIANFQMFESAWNWFHLF